MGQAKIKQRAAFSPQLIEDWESEDCVNFAIALARVTGWLLHVDWWTPSADQDEDIPINQFKPLRVYVADNHDQIFDVRAVKTIPEFSQRTIFDLACQFGNGGIRTRFYGEAELSTLPLRNQPDEAKIRRAIEAIQANVHFLAAIPVRTLPCIPAHQAAQFAYGWCVPFAQALHELTGLEPTALLAVRFSPLFEGTQRGKNGYFHSVVLHPDGSAEDCWGKASLREIAGRFGVLEFKISADEHRHRVSSIQRDAAERYEAAFKTAMALINAHRVQLPTGL